MVISHSYVSLPEGSRDDSPSIMVSIIRHGEKMNEMFGLLLAYCSVFFRPTWFHRECCDPNRNEFAEISHMFYSWFVEVT